MVARPSDLPHSNGNVRLMRPEQAFRDMTDFNLDIIDGFLAQERPAQLPLLLDPMTEWSENLPMVVADDAHMHWLENELRALGAKAPMLQTTIQDRQRGPLHIEVYIAQLPYSSRDTTQRGEVLLQTERCDAVQLDAERAPMIGLKVVRDLPVLKPEPPAPEVVGPASLPPVRARPVMDALFGGFLADPPDISHHRTFRD